MTPVEPNDIYPEIFVVMGVICQLHAGPHTHASPAGGHHEDTPTPTFEVLSWTTAVIPSVDFFPLFLFLMLSIWLPPLQPLAPACELDIPPRHSLP